MALILPTRNDLVSFIETVEMDATSYRLRFYFNSRTESWYMDISDSSDVAILSGLKLTSNWSMTSRFVELRLPNGIIVCIDEVIGRQKPVRNDLGDSAQAAFIAVGDF